MDQATFNFITIAGAVIQLIALIVFFVMASNVARLAKGRKHTEAYWLDEFDKHAHFGNKEQAIQAAREGIWIRYKGQVLAAHSTVKENNLRVIKKVWEPRLQKVGEAWPEMFKV